MSASKQSQFASLNNYGARTGDTSFLAKAGRARRRRSCAGLTARHRAASLGSPRQLTRPFRFPRARGPTPTSPISIWFVHPAGNATFLSRGDGGRTKPGANAPGSGNAGSTGKMPRLTEPGLAPRQPRHGSRAANWCQTRQLSGRSAPFHHRSADSADVPLRSDARKLPGQAEMPVECRLRLP